MPHLLVVAVVRLRQSVHRAAVWWQRIWNTIPLHPRAQSHHSLSRIRGLGGNYEVIELARAPSISLDSDNKAGNKLFNLVDSIENILWRRTESSANLSPPQIPVNREKFREIASFWLKSPAPAPT